MEYNALIREYSGKSLKILARVLVSDLKDFPADWKIHYQSEEIDRNATTLEELSCCPKNPLQIYKPVKNGYPISVLPTDGNLFQVVVEPQDSRKILRMKIAHQNPRYQPTAYDLVFSREHFHLSGTVIYMRTAPTNLNPNKDVETLEPFLHDWTKLSVGINLLGECSNPGCVSNQGSNPGVFKSLGFGEIRLNLADDLENILTCPACSNVSPAAPEPLLALEGKVEQPKYRITLKSLHVSHARTVFFEKLADSNEVRRTTSRTSKEKLHQRFKLSNKLERLQVTTVDIRRSALCCVKCDTKIMNERDEIIFSCGHAYHFECANLSILILFKGLKCKICQVKLIPAGSWPDIVSTV